MPNHRKRIAKSVPKGTAPLLLCPQMTALRTTKTANTPPGSRKAVLRVFVFHAVPLNCLKRRAEQ